MTMLKTLAIAMMASAVGGAAYAQDLPVPPVARFQQGAAQARQDAARAREAAERIRREAEARAREAQQRRGNRFDGDRGPEFTEPFSKTVRIGRNGSLDLSNVAGDITVTGGGGDDLKIDAVKRVRQRSEQEARAILSAIQIVIDQRGSQVDVRTEHPDRRNSPGRVDYTVALPDSSNVSLRTISGDVRVSNIRGELRVESVSGDVTASSAARLRAIKTVSGDLQLTDAQGEDVAAGTVSGDVIVRNLKVRSIDLELVSGDIRFDNVTSDRANLRTISGDIDFAGRLARNGRYQFQSQSGDIRVIPADGTGFALDVETFNGDIQTDYTLRNVQQSGDGPRRGPGRTLRGTFGDNADAVLILRSFSGDVSLNRR
jgi:hypothetical protein